MLDSRYSDASIKSMISHWHRERIYLLRVTPSTALLSASAQSHPPWEATSITPPHCLHELVEVPLPLLPLDSSCLEELRLKALETKD